MTILFRNKKVTASEFAKLSIEDALDASLQLELEQNWDYMTPKEREQVVSALHKQRDRVVKFLDWGKLWAKFSRRAEVDKRTISKHY